MTTPDFRALCAELLEAWQLGDDIAGPMNRARAALKVEPEGQGPSETDLYDLAEMFNGDPVPAMRRALEVWGNPPASEAPAEALAARPLLERVAQLGDVIGRQTVAQVQQLTEQAAVWLRENPPGQPVAIEPRGCPTPGACSCVEPTPPAPQAGEVGEVAQWLLSMRELAGEHNPEERRQFTRAATLLQRLASPAYLVVPRPPEGFLDLLKSPPGEVQVCAAGVSIEPLGDAPHPTFQDAVRLAEGCHDYSGGHSGVEGEAWHGGIDTVVAVLKKATDGPWDSQTMAVYGVGVEAQAGDVTLAGDRRSAESLQLAHESCRLFGTKNGDCPDSEICWLDMLPCSHYENCATSPAPQSGEVEA